MTLTSRFERAVAAMTKMAETEGRALNLGEAVLALAEAQLGEAMNDYVSALRVVDKHCHRARGVRFSIATKCDGCGHKDEHGLFMATVWEGIKAHLLAEGWRLSEHGENDLCPTCAAKTGEATP
jgi:hypothetical protein